MTKEELEKATWQELVVQRDYCGVDGYYGDYLDNVNAEMLKRFNRLAELEKENADLEAQIEQMKCCGNCGNERCTSKYRGNSAYHRQADGFACADNEDWKLREMREND